MLRVQLAVVLYFSHMMYSLVHLVIWSSHYEFVFFSWVCFTSFVFVLHLLCWCVLCFRYEMSFHLYIMITLVWPIMEDIEPIDLGLGDWPREFEIVTYFTSIPWSFRLGELPILSLTWHHPLVPLYDLTTFVRLSILQYQCLFFPSFLWSDQVESEMIRLEVSFAWW